MPSLLDGLPEGSRVAVIRLRSLGDCVLATPGLRLLKQTRPDLALAILVESRFRDVFTGNPDLAAILPPELGPLRAWSPDVCINLHGGTRSAWITLLCGARWKAGFTHYRFPWVYNVPIPRAQETLGEERPVHTAEHVAAAMFHLGVPRREIPRAIVTAEENAGVARGSYAILHPFASHPAKVWPAERFLAVAEQIRGDGLEPVFLGGPGDDLTPFRAYRTLHGRPLGEIKSWMRTAALFLGNDSGPAHLAAAFGVPVVVLFGSSDPAIWYPWRTASAVLTHPEGIAAIREERVLEATARLRVPA